MQPPVKMSLTPLTYNNSAKCPRARTHTVTEGQPEAEFEPQGPAFRDKRNPGPLELKVVIALWVSAHLAATFILAYEQWMTCIIFLFKMLKTKQLFLPSCSSSKCSFYLIFGTISMLILETGLGAKIMCLQ